MLTRLGTGPRQGSAGLAELLLECHGRIRAFLALAREVGLASELDGRRDAEACAAVERYLTQALPLHVADEERSLVPRLRGHAPELDRALEAVHDEHGRHEPLIAVLLAALARVREAPAERTLRPPLAEAALAAERELLPHLEREEALVFPAIATWLDEPAQASVASELRARRAES